MTADPFDDIRDLVAAMPAPDNKAVEAARAIMSSQAERLHPFGNMSQSLEWLAGWQGRMPAIDRPLIAVFAGTHGVSSQILDTDIIVAASQRVKSLTEGTAAIRGIAASLGSAFKVYELGVEHPSENFTQAPSLSEKDCAAAIAFGMEVVAEGADIIALGSAGFGAATAAAGIMRGIYGGTSEYWADGTSDTAKARIAAVESGARLHQDKLNDPLHVLRCFGGRDIAGMVGAILAARHQSIPVILDGYVVCSAAAVLHRLNPDAISHCIAGHVTSEPAHQAVLDRIELSPLLDLGIGIGDGTGAGFAMGMLRSAGQGFATLKPS